MFCITVHFSISGTTLHAMQGLKFHTCSVEQEAWHKNLWHSCTQKEEEKLFLMCDSPKRDILFEDGEDDPGLLLWINKTSAVSMWVPCQAWPQACSFAFLLCYCKVPLLRDWMWRTSHVETDSLGSWVWISFQRDFRSHVSGQSFQCWTLPMLFYMKAWLGKDNWNT